MEIFDPIHGVISIDPLAKKIIDTVEFQRLRNIKQLGCCYYVFPGASHNRFEHSLGVYHLSNKYISILNSKGEYINDNERKCIKIAALIHDIGHGPFSHLFDDLLPKDINHEYRSGELFKLMNQKYKLGFTYEEIELILKIIFPKDVPKDKKYLYQIVSNKNGIDVDRIDYIMRDIKMIGLNYGIEYERIMNYSYIKNNEIIYSEKVRIPIEDFFRTRFIMYKEVYNHHAVRGIEYMMKEFIKKIDPVIKISESIKNSQWGKFIEFNDSMIDIIDIDGKELIQRIKTRDIYKSVGEIINDNYIDFDYLNDNLIIDQVKIQYYGKEECLFFNENGKQTIHKIKGETNKNQYITTIYYKEECFKEEAEKLFQLILK